MSDLTELARPFPSNLVHNNPSGGGSYVSHSEVVQRLLFITGGYDYELVQIVRGHVSGKPPDPKASSARAKAGTPDLEDAIVGAVCRLTVTIDGRRVVVEEVGDCESPHNWPHDGARLKDAMSDSLKRCAMRFGLGLHLWAQQDYFLYDRLKEKGAEVAADQVA